MRASSIASRTRTGAVPPSLVRLSTEASSESTSNTPGLICACTVCMASSGRSASAHWRSSAAATSVPVIWCASRNGRPSSRTSNRPGRSRLCGLWQLRRAFSPAPAPDREPCPSSQQEIRSKRPPLRMSVPCLPAYPLNRRAAGPSSSSTGCSLSRRSGRSWREPAPRRRDCVFAA